MPDRFCSFLIRSLSQFTRPEVDDNIVHLLGFSLCFSPHPCDGGTTSVAILQMRMLEIKHCNDTPDVRLQRIGDLDYILAYLAPGPIL